jgi:hypothetical protein
LQQAVVLRTVLLLGLCGLCSCVTVFELSPIGQQLTAQAIATNNAQAASGAQAEATATKDTHTHTHCPAPRTNTSLQTNTHSHADTEGNAASDAEDHARAVPWCQLQPVGL